MVHPLLEFQVAKLYDRSLMQDGYYQDCKEKIIEKLEIECFIVLKVFSILVDKIVDHRIQDQEPLILMKQYNLCHNSHNLLNKSKNPNQKKNNLKSNNLKKMFKLNLKNLKFNKTKPNNCQYNKKLSNKNLNKRMKKKCKNKNLPNNINKRLRKSQSLLRIKWILKSKNLSNLNKLYLNNLWCNNLRLIFSLNKK